MRQRRCHWRCGCVAAVAAMLASRALAVTSFWDGGPAANTNWDTAGNWVGDAVPPATNDVQFATGFASGTSLNTNGNRTANSLIINTLIGFTLNGGATDALTLSTGNVTRNDIAGTEASHFIAVDIAMGANGTWNIAGAGALQMDGSVTGSGRSLTKTGAGTLILSGGASYTSGTFINGGVLQLNLSGAGSGAITVASGAELALNGGNLGNVINLNGTGLSGSGGLRSMSGSTISGALILQSNSAINTVSGVLLLNGSISDGASTFNLTKNGVAELRLTASNSYNGTTTINAGTLTVSNNNALGNGAVTVVNGASLGLLSGTSVNLPLTLNGVATTPGALFGDSGSTAWAGPITLATNSNIGVNAGTLTISGGIGQGANTSSLTKVGLGTLTLSAANTYTGSTTVSAGILVVSTPPAIQQSSSVNVIAGAELDITGGGFLPVPLTLAGSGVGGNGALRGLSGASAWNGSITASSNITIGAAGSMSLNGPVNVSGNLTKVGAGSLTLTNAANAYSELFINAGTLNAFGDAGLSATAAINVADGATVMLGGGATINRSLRTNGDAVFGNLGLITGASTWAGPIKFVADTTIFAGGTLTVSGNIDGTGLALTKKGTGRLILSGVNSFASAGVTAGTLTLTSGGSGPATSVNVSDGASVEFSGAGTLGNVPIHISGDGAAGGGALRAVNGNSSWSGVLTLDANSSLFADAGAQLTLGGSISGFGVLTKRGPGTLVLSGFSSNNTGGTIISEGTVAVSDEARLGGGSDPVAVSGGKLVFNGVNVFALRDYNLTNGRLQSNANVFLSGRVRGGFMMGPGVFNITSGLSGVTALAGSNINASGTTALDAFSNGGNLTTSSAISWDGGVNSSSGVLTVQSNTLTTTAFTNDGVITINGTLLNNSNSLTSGGGSRITINSGGTLNSGLGLHLNGALLVNNGTVIGATNVNFGSLAKGAGVYGSVVVGDGGRFSPGNSPGTVTTGATTWNSGGGYLVEIGNTVTDFWHVDGILKIAASADHPFTISVASIDDLIFDYTRDASWSILHADEVVGFEPSAIALDVSGFSQDSGSGNFSLQVTSNDILVHFSAVPEPAAMAALLAGILLKRRQRRRFLSCSHGEVT